MTTERTTVRTLQILATAAAVALLAACGPSGTEAGPSADASASAGVSASASASAEAPAPGGLTAACTEKEDFTYEGAQGETALDLLLEEDSTAEVSGKGKDAYVTGICGYTASEKEQEFWALYVDGEMAQVGAGSLETEDGQEITWKLETY
ncbi:DUF4430 domain-containing protein [Myceligenerans crystallogenes]|uniref:DUF4430 domain-containing protein n=1 Tax=Myceligenerans crystallogenes TaxID=316335 RepID=UPI0031E1E8D9